MGKALAYRSSGPDLDSYSRRNLLNRKRGSIAHSLSLSTSHRPDMTEILSKRSSIHPSFTADKVSASGGNGARDR